MATNAVLMFVISRIKFFFVTAFPVLLLKVSNMVFTTSQNFFQMVVMSGHSLALTLNPCTFFVNVVPLNQSFLLGVEPQDFHYYLRPQFLLFLSPFARILQNSIHNTKTNSRKIINIRIVKQQQHFV